MTNMNSVKDSEKGGLLEKRGVTFFKGGGRNLTKKINQNLKYLMTKKKIINKNIFLRIQTGKF